MPRRDAASAARWPAPYRVMLVLTALGVGAFYLGAVQVANEPFDWSHEQFGYYNLLGRALANGRLELPIQPAPELLALPDPWDPDRNAAYRVLDLVLYNQRYYLYHGVTPAALLFTPWLLLTGHELPETFAAFLFCFLGYLCSGATLLRWLAWLESCPSLPVFAGLLAAIGFCQGIPFLLQRVWVYEVAIAGGYFCLSAGFWFYARGLLAPRPGKRNLALAGLLLGLAAGCRPHLGAAALLAALFLLWRLGEDRPLWAALRSRELAAFTLPVTACLLLLALYNYARFQDPLEFGLRYQMAGRTYFRPAPALANLLPGLYYLLACPPAFERVFPFVRLALRMPFNALDYPLPARYFVEPIAGAVTAWPLTILALAAPMFLRRFPDRAARALCGAICLSALASVVFIASLGLVSHRYEVDFLPSFVLLGSVLLGWASARGRLSRVAGVLAGGAAVYGLAVNLAIGLQGPYDGFVHARPGAYVKLARFFSPVAYWRPRYDPLLAVEASFEFPEKASGPLPLIAAGRGGCRYLLSAETLGGGRLRLLSTALPATGDTVSAEVLASSGALQRLHLDYRPEDRTIAVRWNGNLVLRHSLRFLVTAPAQVTVGEDVTDTGLFQPRFPGRFSVISKQIDGVAYR